MATSPQPSDRPPPTSPVLQPDVKRDRRSGYLRNLYLARKRGPRARTILLFLALFALLLIADGVYVGASIQTPLRESARLLDEGTTSLQEGEAIVALGSFQAALVHAERATDLADRPSLWVASRVPFMNGDARAVQALANTAELLALAGIRAEATIEVLGGTSRDEIAEQLYSDGRLQFETLEQGHLGLENVAALLIDAENQLREVPPPRIGRIAIALEAARERVSEVVPRATGAAQLLDVIPRMMGRDEARNYFVAFEGTGEARGSGGSIGMYGVLEADDGRVRLTHVGSTFELGLSPKKSLETDIVMPAWYAARYGDVVNAGNINRTPHFPVVARALLQIYENSTGIGLDGVWSFDPTTLQTLTEATGPIKGVGYDEPLGPDNAARILLEDSYLHFENDTEAQQIFLRSVIDRLYTALASRQADTADLLQGLASSAAGGNFKLYSVIADEEETLADLGLEGALEEGDRPRQLVFHNNLEGNKVDSYLTRTVRSVVELVAEGEARVTTTVVLQNDAPSGPPSVLLGYPRDGVRPGYNNMQLSIVMPEGVRKVTGKVEGDTSPLTVELEGSLPVASLEIEIPPGSKREVTFTYEVDGIQRFSESGRTVLFVLNPHPRPVPDKYVVELVAPAGYGILTDSESTEAPSQRLTFRGELNAPATIRAKVVRR